MQSRDARHCKSRMSEAFRLMAEALRILDDIGAPALIGNSLDLAMSKLELFLDEHTSYSPELLEMLSQLESEFISACTQHPQQAPLWEFPPI